MNTKLHAICDSKGRPINFFVSAGQVSDYIGARALLSSLPDVDGCSEIGATTPIGSGKRCKTKGNAPASPGEKTQDDREIRQATLQTAQPPSRDIASQCTAGQRYEIMFGRLKDWRRVATRYDRCPKAFFSAIALAATVIYCDLLP